MTTDTETESIEQLDFTPALACEFGAHRDLAALTRVDEPARWIALVGHARHGCAPATLLVCDPCLESARRFIARNHYRGQICTGCHRIIATTDDLLVVIGKLNP